MEKKKELLKPKNDIVFQSLFTQKNERITKNFISALMGENITKIEINTEKELYRERPEDKLGILDLEAEINDKEKVDIEVQLIDRKNLVERMLFYFSKLYASTIDKGEDYIGAKKVVIIAIIDYKLDLTKEIKEMETIWNIIERKNKNLMLTDKLELHIIELSKAKEEYRKNKTSKKAQWMMFINNPNEVEVQKIMKENKEIEEAVVVIKEMTEDEKLERLAFLRQKAIMDEKAIYAAGLDKGELRGKEEGIKQEKIETAKKMKAKNMDINTIIEITELTKEEIEKL
ncbi:MAG: Rpn family recombination-promoting nuclease/putative transposase [Clostridia bacterium]|nr:Rpn family recombination-promoting nuclease/putative transposase [Clostridia bacterium]